MQWAPDKTVAFPASALSRNRNVRFGAPENHGGDLFSFAIGHGYVTRGGEVLEGSLLTKTQSGLLDRSSGIW